MKRNPMDEAISAVLVAPISLVGMCVGTAVAMYLYSTDPERCATALLIAIIFAGFFLMATPDIVEEADKRANARHRGLAKSEKANMNTRHLCARGPVTDQLKQKVLALIERDQGDADLLAEDIIELIAVARTDKDGFSSASRALDRLIG